MDRNLDALNSIERASKTEMEERRRERERGCVYTRDDRWPRSPLQDESGHEGDARDACSLARFGRRLIPSRIVWWSTHGLKFSRADDERSVGDSGSKTSGRHKPGRKEGWREREIEREGRSLVLRGYIDGYIIGKAWRICATSCRSGETWRVALERARTHRPRKFIECHIECHRARIHTHSLIPSPGHRSCPSTGCP